MVIETFEIKENTKNQQISLALHILESIKEYYNLAASDTSREASATRKQVLISVTGKSVRSAKQLNILADEIGARPATVVNEAKRRQQLEEQGKLIPYLDILARKSPEGARIVKDEEKLEVIEFYESENVSDVLKGHNNVSKEVFENVNGEKIVLNRQKRVIKVHLSDLLKLAQKEIGFEYSLRTLLKLRPKWVLLPKEAHILACLCDRCANIKEILKCLSNFTRKIKLHGSSSDKAALLAFQLSTSISDFISKVLHPKLEGHIWHRPECYEQTCESTEEFLCGTEKLENLFQPMVGRFGDVEVELHQHLNVPYTKVDGTKSTKFAQVLTNQSISSIVSLLNKRVFGNFHKQPYVLHRLKMLLGNKLREDVHQNLDLTDVACWTDFSKELEIQEQEECKSGAFGASNTTIQLVGQVYELRVVPPSSPTLVSFNHDEKSITFSKPVLDGGSNVQSYEVHMKPQNDLTWNHFQSVKVRNLSQEPETPVLFGRLSGVFHVRVFARNLCGLGSFTQITLELDGDLPFLYQDYSEVLVSDLNQKYCTFFAEFFFFSDHNDAPKVSQDY